MPGSAMWCRAASWICAAPVRCGYQASAIILCLLKLCAHVTQSVACVSKWSVLRVLYLWHLLPEATSADTTELQALSTADAAFLRLLLLCHAVVWLQQDSSLSTDLASRLARLQVRLTQDADTGHKAPCSCNLLSAYEPQHVRAGACCSVHCRYAVHAQPHEGHDDRSHDLLNCQAARPCIDALWRPRQPQPAAQEQTAPS